MRLTLFSDLIDFHPVKYLSGYLDESDLTSCIAMNSLPVNVCPYVTMNMLDQILLKQAVAPAIQPSTRENSCE